MCAWSGCVRSASVYESLAEQVSTEKDDEFIKIQKTTAAEPKTRKIQPRKLYKQTSSEEEAEKKQL
jgi:hypothetical protein